MHVAVIKYPRFRNATHRADRHGLTGTGDAAGFNHDHDIVGIAAAGGVVQDKYDRKTYDCVWPDWFRTVRHMRGPRMGGITHIPGADGTAICLGIRSGLLGTTSNTMLRGIVPDQLLPKASSLNDGRDAASNSPAHQ